MLRDLGHLHLVGFGEDSQSALVDTTHPCIEPMPQLADEDRAKPHETRCAGFWKLSALKELSRKYWHFDSCCTWNPTQWNVSLRSTGLAEPRSVNIAPCSLIHSECRALVGRTQLAKRIRTHSVKFG